MRDAGQAPATSVTQPAPPASNGRQRARFAETEVGDALPGYW